MQALGASCSVFRPTLPKIGGVSNVFTNILEDNYGGSTSAGTLTWMQPVEVRAPETPSPGFEARAIEVLRDLREAFLHLIESLPNPTQRAADLDKALGVSRTLGWQIHRLATSETPLAAGMHVPGFAAVQQVLRAAKSAGAPDTTLRDAGLAMDAFEAFVEEHAGDRATFATMLASLGDGATEAIDVRTRRQMFRAASQTWGVQLRSYLACQIVFPGKRSDLLDVISIRGLRGIRRLRSGTPFRLSTQRFYDAHDHALQSHPVDADSPAAPPGPRLLREFCTQPTPELDNRYDGRLMHTYLRETPLGNAGALNLYFADISRDFEWQSLPAPGSLERKPNSQLWFVAVRKPMESLVLDTLYHKDMFDEIAWETKVCGSLDRLDEPDPDKFPPEETLSIKSNLLDLGIGPSGLPTPHVPRYREMVEAVCRDAGLNAADFHLYRCIIEYPLLMSVVSVKFLLPERGNW